MLKLTPDSQAKLLALKSMSGWTVLLRDVMAGLCRAENDDLLKLDPRKGSTNEQIISAQAQARAKYAFTVAVEDEVDLQVQEFLQAQDGEKEPEVEEDPDEANALPPRGRLPMEIGGKE